MKPIAALWRLAVAALVAVVLSILIANVITQPVATKVGAYVADFTDVSGLHTGADVRVRGVRVGKVSSLELRRRNGQSIGEVTFTMDERYSISADTRLAIKYQALTGLRYVDVANAADGAPSSSSIQHIPTSMTLPSFDITRLFNGLQPVLATLSPEELNTFTSNVENFLAGDGSGLGPMLNSITTLTQFLSNRQQVVATLVQNLKTVADTMHSHAKDFIKIIDLVNLPVDGAMAVLDELRKSKMYGPEFTESIVRLLENIGFKPVLNPDLTRDSDKDNRFASTVDIDSALDKAFTNLDDAVTAFKFVPAIWENIPPPSQVGHPLECSAGRAELPLPVDVLLNGQKVKLCKQ
ncbi:MULTISPECIES: MlaD family protein [Mycobacteriaceae]|uniref:MlaD family protein n=1 Tax=Mycobacteriaceae TaxID=1762 RepID=UPI0009A5755C|nr:MULTISPECIES: MlaD family protein [Mycobacteriaceae]RUP30773.1 MAG: MCE family protein [Mycolicibacterium sp.]UCZ59699.1 MlaD family protein [Mycolicibacterium phocaicum]SKU01516.1 Mce family protein [Mycobacteroides abscessus subsp. massiliense]